MKDLCLLLVAGFFSGNALAAENSWTGFYAGGNLGYAKGSADSRVALGGLWPTQTQPFLDYFTSNSNQNQNPEGVAYGFQAGYDYQLNNRFVLGIEFDYSELVMEKKRQSGPVLTTIGFPRTFDFSNKVEVDHMLSLRPKLGFSFNKTLVYVTAGYAWTSAEFSSDVISSTNYSKVGKTSKTLNSAIFGAGIEHKYFDNVSIKLEYLKVNGDERSYTTVDRPGNAFPGFVEKFNVDLDYDIIRAGINYRF
jgi:outer membrane immunogenic protein